MKNNGAIIKEIRKAPSGTLIMSSKLYREKFSSVMTEAAFSQAISRLCKCGKIERVSKGIYCCPRETRFGVILPSEREIANYYTNGNNGILVGYELYNALGVSTQISKRLTAYSAVSEDQLKQIGNLTIRKYNLNYTPAVKSIIQIMELLHHFKDIQDINLSAMKHSIEKLAREYREEAFELVQKVIGYPKRTIAFLYEVLEYFNIPNSLSKYLSALSSYSIPKMEELYETS